MRFLVSLIVCIAVISTLFSATPKIFVVNQTSGTVSVIDGTTNSVIATVIVGSGPDFIELTPAGDELYVPNVNSNSVSVINVATNGVTTIPLGGSPGYLSFSSTQAFVTIFPPDEIAVIDLSTKTVIATVTLASGSNPNFIATTPDGSQVYSLNQGNNTVNVINTTSHAIVGTVTVGAIPQFVAFTNTKAFVTDSGANKVSVIDLSAPSTVAATISVGAFPAFLVVSPDQTRVYVANLNDTGSVSVIDASANIVVATIEPGTGDGAFFVAISPDGSTVYAPISTGPIGNIVEVISTANNTVTSTVTVGVNPVFDIVAPDGSAVYVLNAPSFVTPGSVSIINTTSNLVTATIAVGDAPVWAALANFSTPTPSAPTNLTGKQKKNGFGVVYELFNLLEWGPVSSGSVTKFNIYRDGVLIATVGSTTFKYKDHDRKKGETNTYKVTAVSPSGAESAPATVTI